MYASVARLLCGAPEAAREIDSLKTSVYQTDLNQIQRPFANAVIAVKKEVGNDLTASRKLTEQMVERIYAEAVKGSKKPNRKISKEQLADAVAKSVSQLPGVDTEVIRQLFLAMTGTVTNDGKHAADQ